MRSTLWGTAVAKLKKQRNQRRKEDVARRLDLDHHGKLRLEPLNIISCRSYRFLFVIDLDEALGNYRKQPATSYHRPLEPAPIHDSIAPHLSGKEKIKWLTINDLVPLCQAITVVSYDSTQITSDSLEHCDKNNHKNAWLSVCVIGCPFQALLLSRRVSAYWRQSGRTWLTGQRMATTQIPK
jgi:hypothetical protein